MPVVEVAPDKLRAAKVYFPNPIALCLLLACCYKIKASDEETTQSILKLKYMPPSEQIRSWTALCCDNGMDPFKIIYPFSQSRNKGSDCMSCQHIDMQQTSKPGQRRIFRWTCNKHHQMLEAYCAAERILLSPAECADYSQPSPRGGAG